VLKEASLRRLTRKGVASHTFILTDKKLVVAMSAAVGGGIVVDFDCALARLRLEVRGLARTWRVKMVPLKHSA
jgi:hypothetical protein